MRLFPRFSLRTLVLFCVLCGAVEGVWIKRQVWVMEYSLSATGIPCPDKRPISLVIFDNAEKHLLISDGFRLHLIDLDERKVCWETPLINWPYINARFMPNDDVIELSYLSMGASLF